MTLLTVAFGHERIASANQVGLSAAIYALRMCFVSIDRLITVKPLADEDLAAMIGTLNDNLT